MAKLATPRLIDVEPTATGLGSVSDRLTEAALDSANGLARITVSDESGALCAVIALTIADDSGTPYFADLAVSIAKDAGPEVTGRVNRLLNGYTIRRSGLVTVTTKRNLPPKVGKYWRTGKVSMFHAGKVIDGPANATGSPTVNGTNVNLRWSVRPAPALVIEPNSAHSAFAVLTAPSKASAPKRAPKGRSVTPKTSPAAPLGEQESETAPAPLVQSKSGAKGKLPTARASRLPANHPGIFRDLDPRSGVKVHVDTATQRALDAAYLGFTEGDRTVIVLRGPSGAGKTITAIDLAARHNLPFWKVDVAAQRDFADWAGSVNLITGAGGNSVTEYVPSQFVEAVSADGPYAGIERLVLLDEGNRAETAGSLNALLPVLDGTGSLYIPDARKSIKIDPMVLFVMTVNIGAGFTGTTVLDTALQNRGTCWEIVDYPTASVEATILVEQSGIDATTAKQLVDVAGSLRQVAARGEISYGVSTRQLVSTALLVKRGLTPAKACLHGFAHTFDSEGGNASEHFRVTTAIKAVFGAK